MKFKPGDEFLDGNQDYWCTCLIVPKDGECPNKIGYLRYRDRMVEGDISRIKGPCLARGSIFDDMAVPPRQYLENRGFIPRPRQSDVIKWWDR